MRCFRVPLRRNARLRSELSEHSWHQPRPTPALRRELAVDAVRVNRGSDALNRVGSSELNQTSGLVEPPRWIRVARSAQAALDVRRIPGRDDMLDSPLSRLAGPMALAAGVLIVVAQLVWLPFDPDDHVATSTDPVFQVGNVIYMLGFLALMLALIGAYGWGLHKAPGRLGLIAVVIAIVGTMLLGGDLWFETFAVPWLADEAPAVLDKDAHPASTLLAIGAVSSYLSFAVGWALFGIANYRARVFPTAICVAIVIGGLIGFRALLSPTGIPLGLAVGWLGVWMMRAKTAASEMSRPDLQA
jgi:hypothetical protein